MLLRCNLCLEELRDNATKKTDVLWLRTIRGVDFLVCKFHRRDYVYRKQVSEGVVSNRVPRPSEPNESALPN